MPTMNIKDPEVHRLAERLARRRRTTLTDAVRQALTESLGQERTVEEKRAAIEETVRQAALIDAPYLTDDDLYDEDGLPK